MLKRWCGNVYRTSELSFLTFNTIWAKRNFGRHVGGEEYASNIAVNANHTILLKNAIKYPLNAFPLKFRMYKEFF